MTETSFSQSTPALQTFDLTKDYGATVALKGLNLRIEPGQVYCLLGSNGAGKTTTIRLFLNFTEASSGEARVFGKNVQENTQETRSRMTYIPEQVALYPELSGVENLQYLLSLSKRKALSEKEIREYLVRAGLPENKHGLRVQDYSKGMRQKVGLALALARASDILLLDEPTSGLDPASADEFSNLIANLASQGTTVLMVTHDLYRAQKISDRIGIMKDGVLVEDIKTSETPLANLETLYLKHMRG